MFQIICIRNLSVFRFHIFVANDTEIVVIDFDAIYDDAKYMLSKQSKELLRDNGFFNGVDSTRISICVYILYAVVYSLCVIDHR